VSRRLARIGFIALLAVIGIALGIAIGQSLFGWGGGSGAALGVIALLGAGAVFDRLWRRSGAVR
jgi:hypothetical protein